MGTNTLSGRCAGYTPQGSKTGPCRGVAIVCILKGLLAGTQLARGAAGPEVRVYVFIDEHTSVQAVNVDENQTAAGARSLKRFKCEPAARLRVWALVFSNRKSPLFSCQNSETTAKDFN